MKQDIAILKGRIDALSDRMHSEEAFTTDTLFCELLLDLINTLTRIVEKSVDSSDPITLPARAAKAAQPN